MNLHALNLVAYDRQWGTKKIDLAPKSVPLKVLELLAPDLGG